MLNWSIEGCQHARKKRCCLERRLLPPLSVGRLCRAARSLDVVKDLLEVRARMSLPHAYLLT
jgi:hypothetical protein